ncbi:TIGR02391 family protein [Sphingomonas sp. AX6]|uniref:TIGR02391 family protein n=1 Tax=Sphingomonas sp. AX6 TaxID=2653171 RepID=UPI00135B90C0|nr:TIGR02391 family protein [Sphingomonas sp. AX6]
MSKSFAHFERLVRIASDLCVASDVNDAEAHPFEERNIHPEIASVSMKLFDDGHYSQATFEAFKFIDLEVKRVSGVNESGHKLMMAAFSDSNPKIKLTRLVTASEIDEQGGYRFIFAGAMSAIRNPRGHEINIDPIGRCLDHLSFASVLLRRLDDRQLDAGL